ncbi:MAG: hypothetical protein O7B98_05840, partial [Alphaproteobacteria bacterium]|nr:hypothetical protein [Alphaproteobacteria bacterium]
TTSAGRSNFMAVAYHRFFLKIFPKKIGYRVELQAATGWLYPSVSPQGGTDTSRNMPTGRMDYQVPVLCGPDLR